MMILVIGAGFQCTKTWATLEKKRNGTQACREARSRPRRDFSRLAGFGAPITNSTIIANAPVRIAHVSDGTNG